MANEKFKQFRAGNMLVPIDTDKLKPYVSSEVLDKIKRVEGFKTNDSLLQGLSVLQFEIGGKFYDYNVEVIDQEKKGGE